LGVLQHRFRDDNSGIVDEESERSKLAFGRCDYGSYIARAGNVTGDRQALPSGSLDLSGQLIQPADPSRGQRHLRPGSSENRGEVMANAARSAGHECRLPGEIEARQLYHAEISFARSRNSNFWILPVEVLGNGPKTIVRGTL